MNSADDLRAMDLDTLVARVKSLEEDVFRVRFQHATSQLQNSSKLVKSRRDLARAKTILRLKELGKVK
ncbi:MAG: 50S ribosomal protein L29 [Deltaproteobacteria bacterium]|nr:50S ribosomal protein L29 [Deltaproteobacteria bacterium]